MGSTSPICQGYIWDFIISNYKHPLLVTKWGLHVITLQFHFIGYKNAYIGFGASLFRHVLMYYLIIRDLKLQHAFNNCMYCVMLYFIFIHSKMQKFTISHNIMITCFYHLSYDYIGHNNTFIKFGDFLVMPCVNVLFDN